MAAVRWHAGFACILCLILGCRPGAESLPAADSPVHLEERLESLRIEGSEVPKEHLVRHDQQPGPRGGFAPRDGRGQPFRLIRKAPGGLLLALAKKFTRSGEGALNAEQIENLRSLGYIQ